MIGIICRNFSGGGGDKKIHVLVSNPQTEAISVANEISYQNSFINIIQGHCSHKLYFLISTLTFREREREE